MIRKIALCVVMFSAALPLFAGNGKLSEIIEKNTAATGGAHALQNTKSVEMTVLIEEPKFTVKGIYKATRDQQMRIDIYAGEKWVFAEGFNGAKGWQLSEEKGEAKDSSEAGSAALRNGTILPGKMYGLNELIEMGHSLSLKGREKLDGIDYYVLNVTMKDGFTVDYYINPDTWLIERRRDYKALHPDVDPTKKAFETKFSDFRKDGGVIRAYKAEEYEVESGAWAQRTTLQKIEINKEFPSSIFEKP